MEALTEDLLMSGAYDDALTVTKALHSRAISVNGIGRDGCRLALDRLGESMALRETAALIGDVDEDGWTAISAVINSIGVASVEALRAVVAVEQDSLATTRAGDAIVGFGKRSVARLAPLIADSHWFVQRRGARLLGRIGSAEAVPMLQPMLRLNDPRLVREAVTALGLIHDPAAARAVHTVLRAATGVVRKAVIEALVGGRDPRVVPMLVQILEESEPLGKDHDVVIETIDGLGTVGTDAAVPVLVKMAQRRKFFGGKKLRVLKERSIDALVRVHTAKADAAIKNASEAGDRMLKKIAASRAK
jgi:HEAT repeat protein